MAYPSNPKLTPYARELRKNMTQEERKLWYFFLRHLSVPVKRQKTLGYYIVDFYCHRGRIVIELDGSQHFEDAALVYDRKRDAYLESLGLKVLRYTNLDIAKNFTGVCDDILMQLEQRCGEKITMTD